MSILIKGMEMPTTPVLFCVHPDGKVFADLEGNWREYKAVPVPPHGGLKKHDVRPVVLCRDCKHRPARKDGRIRAPEDADGYTDYKCPFVCDDSWYNRMPADDDYCSHGEKREES